MEEAQTNPNMNRDSPVVQAMEVPDVTRVPRRNGDTLPPLSYHSPSLEAMELGQK